MPLAYLLPEEAQTMLIASGKYTTETVPGVEKLTAILEELEDYIDAWIGYRMAPTEYVEELPTNYLYMLLVHNYPVLEIKSVEWAIAGTVGVPPVPNIITTTAAWEGGRSIAVGSQGKFRITYVAGLLKLPPNLKRIVLNILKTALDNDGSLDFLNAPVRDLSSVSLPGGMSQSYRLGSNSASGSKLGEMALDRALAPLSEYKRKIIT